MIIIKRTNVRVNNCLGIRSHSICIFLFHSKIVVVIIGMSQLNIQRYGTFLLEWCVPLQISDSMN